MTGGTERWVIVFALWVYEAHHSRDAEPRNKKGRRDARPPAKVKGGHSRPRGYAARPYGYALSGRSTIPLQNLRPQPKKELKHCALPLKGRHRASPTPQPEIKSMILYIDIIADKPFTVRGMPWLGMADAAALYQSGGQANVFDLGFSRDWFDDDGLWPNAHAWAGERTWEIA